MLLRQWQPFLFNFEALSTNMTMKNQNWLRFLRNPQTFIIFKKYVHQTFNDKSPLLLANSLCLSLVFVMKFALSKHIF